MGKMTEALRKARMLQEQKAGSAGQTAAPEKPVEPVPAPEPAPAVQVQTIAPAPRPVEPPVVKAAEPVAETPPAPTVLTPPMLEEEPEEKAKPRPESFDAHIIEEEPEELEAAAEPRPVPAREEAPALEAPRLAEPAVVKVEEAPKTGGLQFSVLPDVEPGTEKVEKPAPRKSVLPDVEPTLDEETARNRGYLSLSLSREGRTADDFRGLRNRLAEMKPPVQVILVTSASPGEGKTTVAMNLAFSFAGYRDEKVLLVDANFLRPKIGEVMKLGGRGLVQAARGEASLDEASVKTGVPGLWVISAGSGHERAEGLLGAKSASELFKRMKERFSRVIVDMPAATETGDGFALGSQGGIVLVTARRNHTRRRDLHAAVATLKERGVTRIECVFVEA